MGVNSKSSHRHGSELNVHCMGWPRVFRSKYVQFPVICSLQYSININTVEVDPHSDLLHICIAKPKNIDTVMKRLNLPDELNSGVESVEGGGGGQDYTTADA